MRAGLTALILRIRSTITKLARQLSADTRPSIGRFIVVSLLVATGGIGISIVEVVTYPATAHAADSDTYPWPSAPCEFGASGGSTCANPNNSGDLYDWFNSPSGTFSGGGCGTAKPSALCFDNYGYEYRNCTSYVAQKISQEFDGRSISGWGNAWHWAIAAQAAGYVLDSSPEEGDIAVWGTEVGDGFGHVAYVASVTNGVATFDEYNVHGTGAFTDNYTSQNHPGGQAAPDEYIHMGTPADESASSPSPSSPPPPPPDSDGDGIPDAQDTCPQIPGPATNRGCPLYGHTVTGNFANNAPYTDAISFYDLGSDNLGAFLSTGGPGGLSQPQLLWTTGVGNWDWGASTFVAGNFYGNDSYTDIIGFYDYGNGQLGAFLYPGTANGIGQGQMLWELPAGSFDMGSAQFFAGNFGGSSGGDSVVALYDYGNGQLGAFLFAGTGSGIQEPQGLWSTLAGTFDLRSADIVAGSFYGGDAYTDLVAFYGYTSNSSMGEFVFPGFNGGIQQPISEWNTGPNTWNVGQSSFIAGNFAPGATGTSVMGFYDYGGAEMSAFLLAGDGSGTAEPQGLWTIGPGSWDESSTKFFTGNFSGSSSGPSSIFEYYNYGNSQTGGGLMSPLNGGGVSQAGGGWATGTGQWNWLCM